MVVSLLRAVFLQSLKTNRKERKVRQEKQKNIAFFASLAVESLVEGPPALNGETTEVLNIVKLIRRGILVHI